MDKLSTGKERAKKSGSSFFGLLSGKKNQGGVIALVLLFLLLPSLASAESWVTFGSSYGNNTTYPYPCFLDYNTQAILACGDGVAWTNSTGSDKMTTIRAYTDGPRQGSYTQKSHSLVSAGNTVKHEHSGGSGGSAGAGASWQVWRSVDYVPPPVEPATCNNGVQDPDEDGIDCGGSCTTPDDTCTEYCPELWTLSNGICSSPLLPMVNGVCPPNYDDLQDLTNQTCQEQELSTYANADYLTPTPADTSFETREADVNTDTSATYSKTDNGDGTTTSTITEVSTTTADNQFPVTTTRITTTIYNTSTGEPISVGTTEHVDKEEIVGENQNLGELDGSGNEVNSGSINFEPLYAVQSASLDRFPISLITTMTGVFDTWEEAPSPPKWDLELNNPWGQNWAFSIDLEPMSDLALIVRQMMACFLVICGFFLIYKRWV